MNKKVYRVGKKNEQSHKGSTEFDVTEKDITPMGGFPHYGIVNEDFLMLKVCLIFTCCVFIASCQSFIALSVSVDQYLVSLHTAVLHCCLGLTSQCLVVLLLALSLLVCNQAAFKRRFE